MVKPTHTQEDSTRNRSIATGFIVKQRPIVQLRSIYQRAREFVTVVEWVTGFLFLGITCLLLFVYLVYTVGKHLLLLVIFTVSVPTHRTSAYAIVQWSNCETCYFVLTLILSTCYIRHWQHDMGAEDRGSHPWKRLRHLRMWDRLANYFPVQLIISKELLECGQVATVREPSLDGHQSYSCAGLPTDRNYLVGYHPHGVFSTGAFVNFMTESTGFSEAFPGLTPYLAILKAHFKAPFYRDYLMALGLVSASRRSLRYLLDEKECNRTGNFVVVVVGGAAEALEAQPGHYRMVITKRFGFFKLALQTGSTLIPCLSFGEQSLYNQVHNEPGTLLRRFQEWFKSVSTFAPPLFYARGLFPYRRPVNTVVGAPIPCELIADPSPKQVAEVKKIYLDSLQKLFWRYKPIYDPDADELVFI